MPLPRPELAILLLLAALLYLWGLSKNGWANDYYSAAVRSMAGSWHDFLYGSFDAKGLMSVDKPPLALWVEALSAKVFGFNSLAILVPQALMGVASVGLLYDLTRRRWGRAAGTLAGLALALTPVVVAISRHNNPDALLVLCSVGALWCFVRALERGASNGSSSRASASASASRRRWAPPSWSFPAWRSPGSGWRPAVASSRSSSWPSRAGR
jgi:4-amino-4-deoxy-L-arabinose transferase-like glycosyltransferase